MPRILVIDDEPAIRHAFQRALSRGDVSVLTAATAEEGLRLVREERPDVVLLDVKLPDKSGLDALQEIQAADATVPVIIITGHATTEAAIRATQHGALDFLYKPVDLDQLQSLIKKALDVSRLRREPIVIGEPSDGARDGLAGEAETIVGRSEGMQEVYKAIGRVAAQDVTVLVTGESGTGKEAVARAIYQFSRRHDGPFLAINCASLPESLVESELFGHEKGAFTGAEARRIGKFEQCHNGTLFLDEIGETSLVTQTKLLRVLEEQTFERVGGSAVIRADVRLIAATNRKLEEMVARGEFRRDLFFRLNVFSIHLPPLRERGDDLKLLVEHYLRRFNRTLVKDVRGADDAVWEAFRLYTWPGNVRELQGVLKQAMLKSPGPLVTLDDLPAAVRGESAEVSAAPSDLAAWDQFLRGRLAQGSDRLHEEWRQLTDRHLIERVMRHTSGNLSHAARILGINRRTLRGWLKELSLDDLRAVDGEEAE